jgi:choline dehydrogenase-like flavoprotein
MASSVRSAHSLVVHQAPKASSAATIVRTSNTCNGSGRRHKQQDDWLRAIVGHPATRLSWNCARREGFDPNRIRFAIRGHFVLDKRTGRVSRNTIISNCRVN